MKIRECYEKFNGNFDDVVSRLINEQRVEKFVLRFLDTNDLEKLQEYIEAKDWEKAFIVAHTAKGMALNLALTRYSMVLSDITEILRPQNLNDEQEHFLQTLIKKAKEESDIIKKALIEYKNANQI